MSQQTDGQTSKKLLKSTAVVSTMTFVSRISGLIRDVMMANILGTNALADAFFVAFRIPNFLRRIFGEGAFSQAFVPVFAELTERNTREAKEFVSVTFSFLAIITLLLSVLGIIFAGPIVHLFAPGFVDEPEKLNATIQALQVMFPYLFSISLVAMSAGVLNTLNRFAVPAVTPVILNLCLIMAMWMLVPILDNAAQALAVGVLIAGFVQVLFQLPTLYKLNYLPSLRFDFGNTAMRRVFHLMLPAIFSVSVAQINMLVNTFLASFLVTGSVSWLYYSDRLMEFPVGVFGIALATVVLPSLSKQHALGSEQGFSVMMDWALRWVVLIAVPATVALFILATPLLSTMFQYNAFSEQDVIMASKSLQAFAVGVCGFIFVKVLAPGFFARKDTKTPMRIAVVSVVFNIVLSVILVRFLQHAGLALAISLAAWLNASLLYITLRRRNVFVLETGWFWFLCRVALAVAAMGAILFWGQSPAQAWYQNGLWQRALELCLLVCAGGASYFIVLLVLGVRPHHLLLRPK